MNHNYSILINTYGRPKYLRRILNYYSDLADSGVSIFVADASEQPLADEKLLSKIKYFHLHGVSYNNRLIELTKKVKTKYVLLCADDDFIIPDAIASCVDFLNKNPDYSSAVGNYICFSKQNARFDIMYPHSYKLDVDGNDPATRLRQMYENYFQTHYAVHRLKNISGFADCMGQLTGETKFMVMLLSMIVAINGKIKVIDKFYSAREHIIGSSNESWVHLDTLCRDKKYKPEYDSFVDVCAEYLVKNYEIPLTEAKKNVFDCFEIYIEKLIHAKKIRSEKKIKETVAQPEATGKLKNVIKSLPVLKDIAKSVSKRRLKIYQENQINLERNKDSKFGIRYEGANFELSFTDKKNQQELEKIKSAILTYSI